jgi:hypothetical protein
MPLRAWFQATSRLSRPLAYTAFADDRAGEKPSHDTTISSSTKAESTGSRGLLRDPDGHLLCVESGDDAPKQAQST